MADRYRRPADAAAAAVDARAASAFVSWQTTWLQRALLRSHDERVVGTVLGTLEAAHPDWLAVIAALHDLAAAEAVTALGDLYALHGRAVAVLERDSERRGPSPVVGELHEVLAHQLTVRTQVAREALRPLIAAGPPVLGTS